QSMTKTDTRDRESTLAQIKSLERVGCEIVRLAVPDQEAAEVLGEIKKKSNLPLIADIHFDHRLALRALEKGVDGLRLNPGNIGSKIKVKEVVRVAKERSVPIRIGVNAGSLEKDLLHKYGGVTSEAMVESALRHVHLFEDLDFRLIKISLKASDVFRTLRAYQLLAEKVDYPFHAGITEAGGPISGTVKSSVGLAFLLSQGLADTIRISLTAPPEEEVRIGYYILASLGLREWGPNFVSCPVCSRAEIDFFNISSEIEKRLSDLKENIKIALMGCMVNGPGEAKEADIGLVFTGKSGVIYKEGKLYRRLQPGDIIDEFVYEVNKYVKEKYEKSNV
ncbi:MAG: flavodoxin-dependent (E)-4-hydroxy-3-methylbut-2-enyl-diphosphate synthase, partial [Candidatus Aminicenantales bacterium]